MMLFVTSPFLPTVDAPSAFASAVGLHELYWWLAKLSMSPVYRGLYVAARVPINGHKRGKENLLGLLNDHETAHIRK